MLNSHDYYRELHDDSDLALKKVGALKQDGTTMKDLKEVLMDDRKQAITNAKVLQGQLGLSDTWRETLKNVCVDFAFKNGYYDVSETVDISDVKPSLV